MAAENQPSKNAALYRVIGALDATPAKDGWKAHCPGPNHQHGDRKASLSIGEGYNGGVVLHCFAGCPTEAILGAVDMTLADLFEQDRNGAVTRRFKLIVPNGATVSHVRTDPPNGKKEIRWEPKLKDLGVGVEQVSLYRLPELLKAPRDATVYLCEGEADTDALAERGLLAVGTVTGAATIPCDESLAPLIGRDVVLWADADEPGRGHMAKIAARLAALETGA